MSSLYFSIKSKNSKIVISAFFWSNLHFGPVGMGAKSKLLNNFLSLGNGVLINHLATDMRTFDYNFTFTPSFSKTNHDASSFCK